MTSLAIEQMYQVLRGMPGTMDLVSGSGDKYVLTVVNPNAPKNRCQETPGLSITLDGPIGAVEPRSVSHLLTDKELEILRTGTPVTIAFGDVEVELKSNPGGHMVVLEDCDEISH